MEHGDKLFCHSSLSLAWSAMSNISYMSTGFAVYLACHMQSTCMYIVCTLAHTDRIVESAEGQADPNADYTGQIRQFSEIGRGGVGTTPRPWVCYTQSTSSSIVQWQFPNGSGVPSGSGQAEGSEFFQVYLDDGRLVLLRGPDYNSPDGEYCCVIPSVSSQSRCVTLSECTSALSIY